MKPKPDATRRRRLLRSAETCHAKADDARASEDHDREAACRARGEAFERGAR